MKITNVRYTMSANPETPAVATVSMTLNNAIAVHGVNIVRKKDGNVFISMASRRDKDGVFHEVYYHPVQTEAREHMQKVLLDGLEKVQADPENVTFDCDPCDGTMEISDIRIAPMSIGGSLAVASVVIDGGFVLRRIRIMRKREDNSLYLSMPGRKVKDGTFRNVYHPISAEAREVLTKAVLDAYEAQQTIDD